ncbi:hypothetical protein FD754_015179 [Muntiacus muntjak]|uniref:Uncharacterized protein n=1 Tax=Muntiacus muntjak TaxID=9888 RepID=A0A5N3VMB4_MUNMU|nr:hypothetical protein FD754_015179 [Muntiacus muntjak]
MPTAKQLADIGCKTFFTSMMVLVCTGRHSSQRQAAEEQKTSL